MFTLSVVCFAGLALLCLPMMVAMRKSEESVSFESFFLCDVVFGSELNDGCILLVFFNANQVTYLLLLIIIE